MKFVYFSWKCLQTCNCFRRFNGNDRKRNRQPTNEMKIMEEKQSKIFGNCWACSTFPFDYPSYRHIIMSQNFFHQNNILRTMVKVFNNGHDIISNYEMRQCLLECMFWSWYHCKDRPVRFKLKINIWNISMNWMPFIQSVFVYCFHSVLLKWATKSFWLFKRFRITYMFLVVLVDVTKVLDDFFIA